MFQDWGKKEGKFDYLPRIPEKTKHVDGLGSNVMGVIYKNEFTPLKIRNMTYKVKQGI